MVVHGRDKVETAEISFWIFEDLVLKFKEPRGEDEAPFFVNFFASFSITLCQTVEILDTSANTNMPDQLVSLNHCQHLIPQR
jgi:hypothetical protein